MNTEQIAESNRDRPLHNQADIEREIHITSRTEGIRGIDIYGTSYLYDDIDNEDGHSQADNILVVRQHTEDCMTEYGPNARKSQRYQNGQTHDVLSQQVGRTYPLLPHQMTYTDGSSLCHGDGKEIDKHGGIHRIGSRGQRIISQNID